MKKENLNEGHRDRLRGKFIKEGFGNFADHEMLEMLLFYAYPRCDTNKMAHKMINEFGSLANVLDADVHILCERLKITERVAVLLHMIPALAHRYHRNKADRNLFMDTPEAVGEFLQTLYMGDKVEKLYVLCLDARRRLIHAVLLTVGTLDEVAVYTREVMKAVFQHDAKYIILSHNHPGGSFQPSRQDYEATRDVVDALAYCSVKVLDHVVVSGERYFSMAKRSDEKKANPGFVAGYDV